MSVFVNSWLRGAVMKGKMFILVTVLIFTASCGTYEPKSGPSMSSNIADRGVDIRDTGFNIKNPSKVILYTVTQNAEEAELLKKIAEKISEKGVETVLDLGQIVDYGDENYRIRTKEKLMSVHHFLQIVAPGIKENEPIVVEIKADSIPKLIDILMNLMFGG
jgi:hypothetical protein